MAGAGGKGKAALARSPGMPDEVIGYLVSGIVLGLSAGLSPGPLMALVVRESLSRSAGAGIRVACAPLLTDVPIVALSVLVLHGLALRESLLGLLALAGAAFLARLGWHTMQGAASEREEDAAAGSSFRIGVLANVLSPHPYLFWMMVGGPMVLRLAANGVAAPIAFVAAFYGSLVGSKIAVAVGCARFNRHLCGRTYRIAMRSLGASLWLMALVFVREAIQYLVGA